MLNLSFESSKETLEDFLRSSIYRDLEKVFSAELSGYFERFPNINTLEELREVQGCIKGLECFLQTVETEFKGGSDY